MSKTHTDLRAHTAAGSSGCCEEAPPCFHPHATETTKSQNPDANPQFDRRTGDRAVVSFHSDSVRLLLSLSLALSAPVTSWGDQGERDRLEEL